MRRYRGRRKNIKIIFRILIVFVVFILSLLLIEIKLKPLMKNVAGIEARKYTALLVNKAVLQELEQHDDLYNELTYIHRDSDSKVLDISSNIPAMNRLKSVLVTEVQQCLSTSEQEDVSIPLGTLIGSDLLHGRGPCLPLKITLSGSVSATYFSTFDSAGINQTRHRIILTIESTLYAFLPGVNTTTNFSTDIPIAETVIVGNVPEFMANIDDSNS